MKKYDDMLGMERPVSFRHPKMNRIARAAQFAPFAALTGFEELVAEEARVTEDETELTEEEKQRIGETISAAISSGAGKSIAVTFFVADKYKKGGSYVTRVGIPVAFDTYRRMLIMAGGEEIPMDRITKVSED